MDSLSGLFCERSNSDAAWENESGHMPFHGPSCSPKGWVPGQKHFKQAITILNCLLVVQTEVWHQDHMARDWEMCTLLSMAVSGGPGDPWPMQLGPELCSPIHDNVNTTYLCWIFTLCHSLSKNLTSITSFYQTTQIGWEFTQARNWPLIPMTNR